MSSSKPPSIMDRARASLNGSNGHHESRGDTLPPLTFADPIPASQLKIGDQSGNWFWHGYFARHTTTLLSSLWKAGKTTLIAHLLKALETGGLFCGQMVRPTRVLYATEEPESVWARRRDAIGFGDHVHFQIRPFRTKAKLIDWIALLQHLRHHVEAGDFGLVFIDPLTTLWPVDKENEAGIVAEALVPLNLLTDRDGELGGSPGRRQLLEALASGVDRGYWQQGGEGKRGDPHQWWRPPGSPTVSVPVPGVYRAGTGTETRGGDEIPD